MNKYLVTTLSRAGKPIENILSMSEINRLKNLGVKVQIIKRIEEKPEVITK